MSRGKVYISGPITGIDFGNRFAFMAARCGLELCGYEVVDPSEVKLDDDASWADYMRADLKLLLDCDFIFMLEGWEDSKGARLERELAERLGIEQVDIDQERARSASPHSDRGAQGRALLFRRESSYHGEDLRAIRATLRPQ